MRRSPRLAPGSVVALAFALAGCGATMLPVSRPPPAPGPVPARPAPSVAEAPPDRVAPDGVRPDGPPAGPFTAAWSAIEQTPDCFFFSGPGALGRDTQLGDAGTYRVEGDALSARFGADGAFHGALTGGHVALIRTATYDFNGPWTTEERIHGTVTGPRSFEGDYVYKECDESDRAQCPGRCTIHAHVVVRW